MNILTHKKITLLLWFLSSALVIAGQWLMPISTGSDEALIGARIVTVGVFSVWGVLVIWATLGVEKSKLNQYQARLLPLVLAALILPLVGWYSLTWSDKAGLFVLAMLFLTLWQVEQKTNVAKLHPKWYWALRTQCSMIVAASSIGYWLIYAS